MKLGTALSSLLLLAAIGAAAPAAGAATIVPNTVADDYDVVADADCSLREAVQSAGNFADFGGCVATGGGYGATEILLSGGATYARTRLDAAGDEDANATGDYDASLQSLTIAMLATATSGAVIEGTGTAAGGRFLDLANGSLSVSGVTIRSGNAGSGDGGGIFRPNTGGSIDLTNVTVSGNFAEDGAGVFASGPGNLTNVTISGNSAVNYGGGLYTGSGPINLNNVTIASNTADSDASGVGNGGGLLIDGGPDTLYLSNTIVAANVDASPGAEMPDCTSSPNSLGYNLLGSTAGCPWVAATGDVLNPPGGPGLGTLAGNGGFTPTRALLAGSPAIDAGNPATPDNAAPACASSDQRGTVRGATRCDIGAFEFAAAAVEGPPPAGFKKKCKRKQAKKRAAGPSRASPAKKCKAKKKQRKKR